MDTRKLINGGKEILLVKGILHQIGEQTPYFSLTGEIWNANSQGEPYGRDMLSGGMLHDEILKHFPGMIDLAEMHLSDIDGVPMHAVENGWYWNGGTKYQAYNRKVLAHHLRITEEEADKLHNEATTKEIFAERVNGMMERWANEAKAVVDKYGLTVERSR